MAREAIFIGYRREDTADVAGRIYDALAQRFGRARIFKDVDNLRPGADFGDYIRSILPRCRVVLVLIGPNWLDVTDEAGRRRLDDPNDWVRIEIETALAAQGLDVVPVLVNGARMPRAEDLPASLHPLLRRHAAVIRRDPDFHDDVGKLSAALRQSVKTGMLDLASLGGDKKQAAAGAQRSGGGVLWGVAAVAAIALGVWAYMNFAPRAQAPQTPMEFAEAMLAGAWRWDGVTCAEGPTIAVDGDGLLVTMAGAPDFRHAIESATDTEVRTLVVEPEQFRGEAYAYRRDGDTLTLTALGDGRVDTWERCP